MATGVQVDIDAGDGWEDITPDVLLREQITITRGRTDRGTTTDPGTCDLLIRNTTGKYSPGNPRSEYYGRIGRNTPLRVTVLGGSTVLRETGEYASGISTPDKAALDIVGDLDIRVDASLDNWYTEAVEGAVDLAGKFNLGNQSWLFQSRDGRPFLEWSPDGSSKLQAHGSTSPQATTGLGRRMAWRATLDVDNGAGGWTVTYYTAPTIAGPWTVLEQVTGTGVTSIYASTTPLRAGNASNLLNFDRPIGEWHAFELRDGIDGTVVAEADIAPLAPGTTSWTDSAGNVWTVQSESEITDRRIRFQGEASSWRPRLGLSAEDSAVAVTASGILRRLGQGSAPLQSTLRRQIPSKTPDAYWPMEDQESATWAASPIAGVSPMFAEGVDWAAASSLPSSSPLPVIRPNRERAGIWGVVPQPAGTPTAWQMQYVYRIDQPTTDRLTIIRIITTGTVTEWLIDQGETGTNIRGYDSNRALLFTQGIGTGTDLFGQWIELRFAVVQSGGDVAWDIRWRDVGGDAGAFSGTWPGTLGVVSAIGGPVIEVGGYSADLDGMALGHVAVWHDNVVGRYDGAITAHAGESAAARMTRLAAEEGLPLTVYGLASETELVGPQRIASLLDLLGDATEADGGILYERLDAVGLAYRPRAALYNQPAALALTFGERHEVAPPLVPVDDDSGIRNDRTVQRRGGSSARVVREDGPLSVAAIGRYEESVTRALYSDEQTEPHAAWLVHLGTWDESRFPLVTVRLHSAPHLIDAVCAMRPGDRITISDPPPRLPPETIDLLAMGYTEKVSVKTWEVAYNCVPGRPWLVAAVEDPVVGHIDTDGSELALAVDADDTTLSVATTSGELWVTAEPPLNANVDFEAGIDGWAGAGATIAQVPAVSPAGGEWGMSITPDGVAVFPHAESEVVLVSEGVGYTVAAWMRCARARYIELNVNWFDSLGVYLATSATGADVIADAWVWVEGQVTAPAGAARAMIVPTVTDTPPVTDVLTVDLVTIRRTLVGESVSDFPWDVMVGGERMSVTGVTGISSPQSFTVVRGLNGFSGSHAAGSALSLANPSYVAL